MSTRAIPFAIAAVFATIGAAQNPKIDKTFQFTYIESPTAAQSITNALRAVAEVQLVSIDNSTKSLTLRGTANQMALVGWLFPQLDRLESDPSPSSPSQDYQLDGSAAGVVRIFYLKHTPKPQPQQEIINAVRSILEVQRIVAISQTKALVVRGTAEQIAASEWLIGGLDQPETTQGQARQTIEFLTPDSRTSAPRASPARVFYLNQTRTPQAMQELVNSVRSLADLQRVLASTQPWAIALRGTSDQVAMAEWLIKSLDKPAVAGAATPNTDYRMPGSSDEARVFYLAHAATPESIKEIVAQVRSIAQIQRVTACNFPAAVALRGTAGQVALAEKLIQEKDRP